MCVLVWGLMLHSQSLLWLLFWQCRGVNHCVKSQQVKACVLGAILMSWSEKIPLKRIILRGIRVPVTFKIITKKETRNPPCPPPPPHPPTHIHIHTRTYTHTHTHNTRTTHTVNIPKGHNPTKSKQMLFIRTKMQSANFWGNPLYPAGGKKLLIFLGGAKTGNVEDREMEEGGFSTAGCGWHVWKTGKWMKGGSALLAVDDVCLVT